MERSKRERARGGWKRENGVGSRKLVLFADTRIHQHKVPADLSEWSWPRARGWCAQSNARNQASTDDRIRATARMTTAEAMVILRTLRVNLSENHCVDPKGGKPTLKELLECPSLLYTRSYISEAKKLASTQFNIALDKAIKGTPAR
jgi:hypothetical protein